MNEADLILAFDTATPNCTIGLTRGGFVEGRVLGALSFQSGVTHSRRLLSGIDWLLKSLKLSLDDVAAIAVGLGPGSFTGLRIGLAAAKGLCHGSTKPLIGISSLDAIAAPLRSEKLICVVMDARKQEVYSCFYRRATGGLAYRCSEPLVCAPRKLAAMIDEPVVMAGDGVDVYGEVFVQVLAEKLEIASGRHRYPEAADIGFLAHAEHRKRNYLRYDQAAPDYVRSSDAELSLVSRGKAE